MSWDNSGRRSVFVSVERRAIAVTDIAIISKAENSATQVTFLERTLTLFNVENPQGAWSKDEEAQLTAIVKEMVEKQGKDVDNDIFWGVVSQKMGGKRGRQQCRNKWSERSDN